MLRLTLDRDYKAAVYLRLSKEDGDFSFSKDKSESDSISNQRLLIMDYLKSRPEITVVREYCDDGYTGANFERPQFRKMMEAVKSGEIDCIVVKDLSRFGREYIDSGNYLQKIFPMLGIRFIAINDNYDNAQPGAMENELILPFKNLMNDSYCRDISVKIRTNLDVKRRSGQFVGSRVVYGYMRDPDDKNRLIVDREAAQIVQDIFRWKLEGLSPAKIAQRLNESGIPSPIEYKKSNGSKQRTPFQTKTRAEWSAVAIYRILNNEIYTGTLVQGKTTTPNHKVKKTVVKSADEWARVENAHEAIISAAQFDTVRALMLEDTRSPVGESSVHPFSGKIFCADCESSMVRKVSRSGSKEYAYFICGGYKGNKNFCSSHSVKEQKVFETVLAVIQAHINAALDISKALGSIDSLSWENRELEKLNAKIEFQEEVISKNLRLKTEAYEDFKTLFISREDYKAFCEKFDANIAVARKIISELTSERNLIKEGLSSQQSWIDGFKKYENISEITRPVVVNFVDKIVIHDNGDIDVTVKHADIFAAIYEYIKSSQTQVGIITALDLRKEAV